MVRNTADGPDESTGEQATETDGSVPESTSGGTLGALDGRSPMLLLIGGGLLVVFAANTWLGAFAGTSYPALHDVVGPAGFLVGVLGVLGLSPTLVDRLGNVGRAAAVLAAIPAVGWTVIVAGSVGNALGVLADGGSVIGIVAIVTIVTTTLSYALFGALALRAGVHSRLVGVSLLIPAVMFVLLLTRVAPPFVVDAGHVVGHLGAGAALWSTGVRTDSAEPTADATP